VWLLLATAFTVGARTRLVGSVLLAGFVYLFALDTQLQSHHAYLLTLLTLLLVVGDSSATLSTAALGRGEREWIAAWPATLIRCQLSIVYAYAAAAKLDGQWLGECEISLWVTIPAAWSTPTVCTALGVATIGLEAFLAFGLWMRRTRRFAFVAGTAFHAAIALTIRPHLPLLVFSLAALAPYLLFLDARPGSRLVTYDPGSPRQARSARWGARLDWLALHRFHPLAGATWEVHGPDGAEPGGRGLVAMLEGLPLTFLWAPALRLLLPRR
jgi:hypothetical protein